MIFQLGERLAACAALVRQGARVADIGTDHALLPVWLIRTGRIPGAIAADVRPGPLQAAAENAARYGVQDRLETRLSDGLIKIAKAEAEDIVIAGMGGELICRIIADAPWLKNPEKRLILQPMTAAPQLRRGLAEMGFSIFTETAVEEGEKCYSVLWAGYTGDVRLALLEEYMGKIQPGTRAAAAYAQKVGTSLRKQVEGCRHMGDTETAQHLAQVLCALEDVFGGKACIG